MAKYYGQKKKAKKRYSRVKRSKELTKLAYDMGLVQRGLKNPESRISKAYEKGQTERKNVKPRTLF